MTVKIRRRIFACGSDIPLPLYPPYLSPSISPSMLLPPLWLVPTFSLSLFLCLSHFTLCSVSISPPSSPSVFISMYLSNSHHLSPSLSLSLSLSHTHTHTYKHTHTHSLTLSLPLSLSLSLSVCRCFALFFYVALLSPSQGLFACVSACFLSTRLPLCIHRSIPAPLPLTYCCSLRGCLDGLYNIIDLFI